jgi:hypothetical protein
MSEISIKISGLSRKHMLIGLAGLVVAVGLAVAAIGYIRQYTVLAGLPREAYQGLNFPVYFPKHPPAGFKFDAGSVSTKPQVLAYKYDYQGEKPVYVSIQPLDPQLDANSFKPTRTISPSIGKGYLVDYDTRTTVAIMTDKALVVINSPAGVPSLLIEQFAVSLSAVK